MCCRRPLSQRPKALATAHLSLGLGAFVAPGALVVVLALVTVS
jgi:hypothetical protein